MTLHAVVDDAELRVGEGGRNPRGNGVTQIAGGQRGNVIRRLARGVDAGDENTRRFKIVALRTLVWNHFVVVDLDSWLPREGLVTRVATSSRRHVNRRGGVARTCSTRAKHFVVIHFERRFPTRELMACAAVGTGDDVPRRQQGVAPARVTGSGNGGRNQIMIDLIRRAERARVVTHRTVVARGNMSGDFARGLDPVVARDARCRRGNFLVIKTGGGYPRRGDMACGTVIRGRHMVGRLSGGLYTVVTSTARRGRGAVVHFRGNDEPVRRVARVARLRGGDVMNGFSAGKLAVVARGALRRYAFKHAIEMTRFAPLLRVQTDERKPGAEVIEILVERLCDRGGCNRRSQRKVQQHPSHRPNP